VPGFAVQFRLDIGFRQRQSRWTAIDHAADGRAVRLTKGSNGKQFAKSITGHRKRIFEKGGESVFYQPEPRYAVLEINFHMAIFPW
jgi:hypothetical protein